MATVFWIGNAQQTAQVETVAITAVAAAGTITATINGKVVTYTCTGSDTTATATAAFLALLRSSSIPEISTQTYASPTATTITATASTPGTPFAGMTGGLVFSAAGGATVTQTATTANSSPSDVGNAKNWLRSGSPGLPQNGDDVIVANSTVPLLYNLSALASIQFATYTRWQNLGAPIGLPEYNPLGYYEYLPTYFAFTGPPAGTLPMLLGQGGGSGPPRERYNVGAQRTALTIMASGSPVDAYAVRFLGTNANNTIKLLATSLALAMLPGEVSTIASAIVDGGATLALGSGVTFSGALVLDSATGLLYCAPASVSARNGSRLTVTSSALTYAALALLDGSQAAWLSDSTITALTMTNASVLDHSGDVRTMTITNATIDADCIISDPNSAIIYSNAVLVNGSVRSGPFLTGPGKTFLVT